MTNATDDYEDNQPYFHKTDKESLLSYCADIPDLDALTPTQIIEVISNYLEEND